MLCLLKEYFIILLKNFLPYDYLYSVSQLLSQAFKQLFYSGVSVSTPACALRHESESGSTGRR
jgi:hypothetical protein